MSEKIFLRTFGSSFSSSRRAAGVNSRVYDVFFDSVITRLLVGVQL